MRQKWMRLPRTWMAWIVLGLAGCGNYHPAPVPPAQPVAKPAPAPAPAEPAAVVEKAEVGAGALGHDYGPGMVTTPVSVYFIAKEKLAYEVAVPQALSLYKAEHGQGPQNMEEFDALMKFNKIKLPLLPQGHEYVYDPEKEELQVRHPK